MSSFADAKHDWESHDEWQFADRDAERKFFYHYNDKQNSILREALEKILKPRYGTAIERENAILVIAGEALQRAGGGECG